MPETQAAETPAATPNPPAAQPAPGMDSVDVRAHELLQKIAEDERKAGAEEGDDMREVAVENPTTTDEPAPKRGADGKFLKKPAAAEADGEEEPAAEAAPAKAPEDERRERLERARKLDIERARARQKLAVEEARAQQQIQAIAQERARLEKLAAELETTKRRLHSDNPLDVLELLSEKVSPDQLADFLIQSKDPAKRAEWAAKRAAQEASTRTSPELDTIKRELAELRQERQQFLVAQERQDAEQKFAGAVKGMADDAPHVAALLDRRPQQVMQRAHAIADHLAKTDAEWAYDEPSTRFAKIVSLIEADLSEFASVFAPQTKAHEPPSKPSTQPAAVSKARTLTSRTTAGRSTLIDDDDFASKSIDERAEELKRLAKRMQR